MNDSRLVFRVVDWDGRQETARSLKKSGVLAAVTVSTDLGGAAILRLLALPDGAAVLGVWYYIQILAAHCERRGALAKFGVPLTPAALARLSGWDVPLIERILEILCRPEVGLLEQVPRDEALRPPVIPEPAPRNPRKPKLPSFTHCPVCNADLVAIAEEIHAHPAAEPCGCHANAGSVGHVANAASVRVDFGPLATNADSGGSLPTVPRKPDRLSETLPPGVKQTLGTSNATPAGQTVESAAGTGDPGPPRRKSNPYVLSPKAFARSVMSNG